jgi:kynurenine formamidase
MRASVVIFAIGLFGCVPPNGHQHAPEPRRGLPAQRCAPTTFDVVDLSHVMHPAMATWPGGVPFEMERLVDYDQGYRTHRFAMGENTGTHLDAPSHFVDGKRSVDKIGVSQLVVPAVVIDIKDKVAADPDYQLSANDVIDWEGAYGSLPVGALVIIHTGWHKRFDDPPRYLNQDAEGVMHFPGCSLEAAALLLERDVVGIGIDTLSVDHGASKDFATHKLVLGANKYMLENLANLEALPISGATVIVGVLPIGDGTQAQARVMALVPQAPEQAEEP